METALSFRTTIDRTCRFRQIKQSGFRLAFEMTRRCNLKCKHCFVKNDCAEPDMVRSLCILQQALESGCRKVIITGGEPLLNKNLDQIIRACTRKNVLSDLNSNLYTLTTHRAEELIGAGLGEASVSLYGNESTHDWLTGVSGSFKRAVQGLHILRRLNIRVDVHSALWNTSLLHLKYLLDLCESLGVESVTFFKILPPRALNKSNKIFAISNSTAMERINSLRAKTNIPLRTIGFAEPNVDECVMGRSILGITADLELLPCLLARNGKTAINLNEIDFKSALKTLEHQIHKQQWQPNCV